MSRVLRLSVVVVATVTLACGGLGGEPPQRPPVQTGRDGKLRHRVDHGSYKAFYDQWGRIERIEHDSNKDGRPDRIVHHDGAKSPHRVEVDIDFDGRPDRWEDFTPEGGLRRYALAEDGRPRMWTVVASDGKPSGYEYDRDGDGRIERTEIVVHGQIGRVELDTDRDGKVDRWQEWEAGKLQTESVDTDADGRPDRRLGYGPEGRITGVERLAP